MRGALPPLRLDGMGLSHRDNFNFYVLRVP